LRKHEVLLSETARRQLNDLPEKQRERVRASLAELADDPFRPRPKADIKALRGPNRNYHRQRIGDYRAIYVVEGDKILVAKILARRKAYAWLD
jgi:mRNA-degrading endonuclease RelE of RelBE toxin-antitoxin system